MGVLLVTCCTLTPASQNCTPGIGVTTVVDGCTPGASVSTIVGECIVGSTLVQCGCSCKPSDPVLVAGNAQCPKRGDVIMYQIDGCDCPGQCGKVGWYYKVGSATDQPVCIDGNILQIGPLTSTRPIKLGFVCTDLPDCPDCP